MKEKDHWDCIYDLANELSLASHSISAIHSNMDLDKVAGVRKALPAELVKASILIEVARVKLSVLAEEWNREMDKAIEDMSKTEVNFDNVEF